MSDHEKQQLLTATEVSRSLRIAIRTVQAKGQRWLETARRATDPNLPSSPSNGLKPIPVCATRYLYAPRDVEEYIHNATREALGVAAVPAHDGGLQ